MSDKMSDKMREDFETWAFGCAFMGLSRDCMVRDASGYENCELHSAWLAWQASRETVEIVLPSGRVYPVNEAASEADYYFDQGQVDGLRKARIAVEFAGLKVSK